MGRAPSLHDLAEYREWVRRVLLEHRDRRPLASLEVFCIGLIQGICTSVLWQKHRERVLIIIEELDRINGTLTDPIDPAPAPDPNRPHPNYPCRPLANSTCPGCRDAWRRELNLPSRGPEKAS